jgi:hypothetical protein
LSNHIPPSHYILYIFAFTHTYTCVCVCLHVYITHTCMHTYIHTSPFLLFSLPPSPSPPSFPTLSLIFFISRFILSPLGDSKADDAVAKHRHGGVSLSPPPFPSLFMT